MQRQLAWCLGVWMVLFAVTAQAAPIFPAGADAELDTMMARHERQMAAINAHPFGLSLDAQAKDQAARQLIDQFLTQGDAWDVKAATGTHVYELLDNYGEYGDLGFFGGVALTGLAFHYMTLKRDGATEDDLAPVRARLVRAAESWHIFHVITGTPGVVARGIRRLVPENPGDPALPASTEGNELTPLFGEDGKPLPRPKNNGTNRADNSKGALPEGAWMWSDSCSKDQMIGHILAMVAMYDAMKNDPAIDATLVERLAQDARDIAAMLMTKRNLSTLEGPLGKGTFDLIIMDADGRPTKYHDFTPMAIDGVYFSEDSDRYNLFNLIMTLGAIKGLHHMTGDADIEEFLYNELYSKRAYLEKVRNPFGENVVDYLYAGKDTNFDVPDMTSVALFMALYLETDSQVADTLSNFMETRWWNREGENFCASKAKQPLWNAIYLAVTKQGVSNEMISQSLDILKGFKLGPYWSEARINCDETELAAGSCLAVDGTTTLTLAGQNKEGTWMATEALDPSIRPTSNFDARSNPFSVNGGGNPLSLNPGGDLLAAYWISRYMQASPAGSANRSPFAREHIPVGGSVEEETESEGLEGGDGDEESMENDVTADGDGQQNTKAKQDNADGCSTSPVLPLGLCLFLLMFLGRRWVIVRKA